MCFMKIVMDSNWCFNFVIILDKSWTLELGQKGGTSTSQLGQGCILYYFWGKTSCTNNQVHPTIHNLQEDTEHKIHWHGTQASKTLGKNGTQNWNLFNHLCFTQLTLVDFFKYVHNILHVSIITIVKIEKLGLFYEGKKELNWYSVSRVWKLTIKEVDWPKLKYFTVTCFIRTIHRIQKCLVFHK